MSVVVHYEGVCPENGLSVCPVLLRNHLHLFQLCRSRKIGYKKLPCNFTERSQGGFLQVGGVIVHSPEKRASEGNSLSEYF